MIKRKRFNDSYWRYYRTLEDRFINTFRYIELDPKNNNAFSDEFASLMMCIGAELDSLFKLNCGIDIKERSNISDYVQLLPDVQDKEIEIVNRAIGNIRPFESWDVTKSAQSLTWWQAYNDIKHGRGNNRECASQKNVLESLAALYLLENMMLKKIAEEYKCRDVPSEYSKLFFIVGWRYNSSPQNKNERDFYLPLDENDEVDEQIKESIRALCWDEVLSEIPEE